VAPKLKIGVRMLSETVRADAREGDIGMQLGEIHSTGPTRMWCCARDAQKLGAGQTHDRGDAGASAAGTIKARVSLTLSRRNRGSGP
jgi:hypothetical protein